MQVIEIEKMSKGRVKVLFDTGMCMRLYSKEAKAYELEVGKVIDEDQWLILLGFLVTRGKKRIYYLLGKKDYTVSQIRKKLVDEVYPEEAIEMIIAYFIKLGFLDDYRYIEKYYDYYSTTKSRRFIEGKLRERGIDSSLLKSFFLEGMGVESDKRDRETADSILRKKYGHKMIEEKDQVKMMRFLGSRGFDYDICKNTVKKLLNDVKMNRY